MKLGEALQERAAVQRKVADLRARISATATTNEDEDPLEDPNALLAEADAVAARLGELIRRINATNSATVFPTGGTITEALARRDVLSTRHATLETAAKATMSERGGFRFGRSELRRVVRLDVVSVRQTIEVVAAERRELDAMLQQLSWETDLVA